jgi:hypothetical protein
MSFLHGIIDWRCAGRIGRHFLRTEIRKRAEVSKTQGDGEQHGDIGARWQGSRSTAQNVGARRYHQVGRRRHGPRRRKGAFRQRLVPEPGGAHRRSLARGAQSRPCVNGRSEPARHLCSNVFEADWDQSQPYVHRYTELKKRFCGDQFHEQFLTFSEDLSLAITGGPMGMLLSPAIAATVVDFWYRNLLLAAKAFDDRETGANLLRSIRRLHEG